MRLISRAEVRKRTSLSQPTLWRLESKGEFPKSVRITKGRVAYDEDAVDAWIEARIRKSCAEFAA